MTTIWQDSRYGVRMLLKKPGFTLVAVLTLALGIGANTAIFSVVNAVLFRPLPVYRPDRLAAVYTSDYSGPLYGSSSYADYVDFQTKADVFDGLMAHSIRALSLSTGGDEAERILGAIVTGNYFDVLGVSAAVGRTFLAEEDRTPGEAPVAVISHGLWQRRFGSDPALVGKTVAMNGNSFTVIGIAPPTFTGTLLGITPDVYVPIMMHAQVGMSREILTNRGSRGLMIMGRLKDGTGIDQARANLSLLAGSLREAYPEQWSDVRREGRTITVLPESQARIPPQVRGAVLGVTGLLMGVVGLVLLIACANVANLLLARATARRKEMGIRLALGAGRLRLVRQLLTESVLLAVLGGCTGLLAALWVVELFGAFQPPIGIPITLDFGMDWRVLAFALGLSVVTGVVFGLAPALHATKLDVVPLLKDESSTPQRINRIFSLRSLLVIAQVAVSLVLMIGAGLFIRSLQTAGAIDPGFRAQGVLIMRPEISIQGYDRTKGKAFYSELVERVEALPQVESVTLAESVPLSLDGSRRGTVIEGYEPRPGEDMEYHYNTIAPRYFETMSIPVVAGREFGVADREGAPGVVIVNETFARRFWRNDNPLGKRFSVTGREGPYLEIVGVARDGKYNTLGEDSLPFFYLPFLQNYDSGMTLHVRTTGDAKSLLGAVRGEIRNLDKQLPISDAKTMTEHLGIALLLPRAGATLLGIFGLLAMALASVGIFGVTSFSVAQRTHEIGIRMALGAQTGDVLKLVVGQGVMLILLGIGVGVAMAFLLTRLMASLLYGVSASDPVTFIGVALLLTIVAVLACYIPARRATKVDPMVALRYE